MPLQLATDALFKALGCAEESVSKQAVSKAKNLFILDRGYPSREFIIHHLAAAQGVDAIIMQLRVCEKHFLKSVRLSLQMHAEHAGKAPGAAAACGHKLLILGKKALLIILWHNIPIDFGVRNTGQLYVREDILLRPESHGGGHNPLGIKGVTTVVHPACLTQKAFLGHNRGHREQLVFPLKLPYLLSVYRHRANHYYCCVFRGHSGQNSCIHI